jgi:hypothetical protein
MISSGTYKVAEHVFKVSAAADLCDNLFSECMDNYEPFAVPAAQNSEYLFKVNVECGEAPEYTEELCQDEEGQQIICGLTAGKKSVFDFRLQHKLTGVLVCSEDYRMATLFVPRDEPLALLRFAVNNAMMVLYAIATAPYNTALFHAAVVSYDGKGYMFLGKSGTGKSTHARLWLKYNEGSELLNDDNPVVRIFDGARAVVYGSPWSGKTPCYKNQEFALGGFVMLSQAPYNKIERLRGVRAYAALVPCISGKRWEAVIADGLHKTENALAMNVPVWYLECLPDEEAAKLCCASVSESRFRIESGMTADGKC